MATDSQRAPRAQQRPLAPTPGWGPCSWRTGSLTAASGRAARDRRVVGLVRGAAGRRQRRGDRRGHRPRYRVPQADLSSGRAADDDAAPRVARPQASGRPHLRRRPHHPDRHRRPARPRPRADAPLRHRPRDRFPDRRAPAAIAEKLDELYRPERAIERLLGGLEPARTSRRSRPPRSSGGDAALDAPVAKLVDAMISDAVREGASDIHAEPTEGGVVVRYRVDGVLREVMRLPTLGRRRAGPPGQDLGQARRHRSAPAARRPRHRARRWPAGRSPGVDDPRGPARREGRHPDSGQDQPARNVADLGLPAPGAGAARPPARPSRGDGAGDRVRPAAARPPRSTPRSTSSRPGR